MPRLAIAVLLAVLCAGCGAVLVLHREVPRPADIPARAYPIVYIAASDDEPSRDVADALAAHLEGSQTRVVRVRASQLLAEAGLETTPTLALLVTLTLGEELRTEMSQVPTTRCAPGSACYGYPERFPIDVHVQVGELLVRAFDPRSTAELGRAVRTEEESEPSPLSARLAVIDRLRALAPALLDVHGVIIDLALDTPSDPAAREAIELARRGQIHAARLVLEARAADDMLEPASRAAVLFDLGQLIRVDVDAHAPDALAEETTRLAAAETQLLLAVTLAPDERHERALQQLRAERTAREDVRAQQAAADTNFGARPP